MEQCYSINDYKYTTDIVGNGTASLTITCPEDSSTIVVSDPTLTKIYTVSTSSISEYIITLPLEDSTNYTITQQQ